MARLKLIFVLLLAFVAVFAAKPAVAQEKLQQLFAQCKERTNAAWTFAGDAAHELQFNNGATTYDEVRDHCFDALIALDSLDMALQQAQYAAIDAAYELKANDTDQTYSWMLKVKDELKLASQFLEASKQNLQPVLDETNTDTINQKLFDTVENLDSCRQHIKRAQGGLKAVQKVLGK